jgi:hypothetical protein
MQDFLGFFCAFVLMLMLFNTVLLIGIAGSVAKMIKSNRGEDMDDRQRWAGILRNRKQLRRGNDATYADTAIMQATPDPRGWDGIPTGKGKNWDGVPQSDE